MRIIGTAGHVDHGKSALVLALTGTDPDRLREEKERGMTIELGFALLRLPSGGEAGIVDVPGHERFIKTMLAGVGGIDLALLVIAADEGVMPQTREHLAIIDLLGIEHGVVALTKSDAVDAETLAQTEAEARKTVAGTTLAGALIIACSALTGAGLDALLSAIEAQLALAPERRDAGRPRLPIDRAFTMPGFGTVVTGTLSGGSLAVGQEVEIAPAGLRARIRGLQNHGRDVQSAAPGQRTAVNLAGIAVEDVRRGMVLALPGTLAGTSSVDVRLRSVTHIERAVRHNLNVTFHTGAAEASGRLLLLDREEVAAGEQAWAQVRLAELIAALPGDRFVIRDPNDTLGGGTIVAIDAPRHRRHHAPTIAALAALISGSPTGGMVTALHAIEAVAAEIANALAEYHERQPLRIGMPREELRSRVGLAGRGFDATIAALVSAHRLREVGPMIALASHSPVLSDEEQRIADAYVASLRTTPYAPPVDGTPAPEIMEYLLATDVIVRAGDVVFAADVYAEMVGAITARLREKGTITLAEARDMFGTSRRYAQALLEHLDAERVTKRVGDGRVLR
jgi:selenocysteine-specific elongation factor